MSGPRAIIVAGPSGVGKGTLIGRLQKEFEALVGFSVSHTTREPRAGELDGVAYNFTTVEKMKKDIADGKFIEHAEVHGRYYGTSFVAVSRVLEQKKLCILDIDVQGCRLVRKAGLPGLFIFVEPPSFKELEQRLRSRGTETEEAISTRLANARSEMEAKEEANLFDHYIVNDDLDEAYEKFKALLQPDLELAQKALTAI